MTERPILFSAPMIRALLAGTKTQTRRVAKPPFDLLFAGGAKPGMLARAPYGVAGDRLWVRETWGFDSRVRHDFKPIGQHDLSGMDLLTHTLYRATTDDQPPRWRPAIHMPRWASRITLEVTEVRCQRLQEISEDDARAEGVESANGHPELGAIIGRGPSYREGFAQLWRTINGARPGCSWADNPWLWCVSFRRITP